MIIRILDHVALVKEFACLVDPSDGSACYVTEDGLVRLTDRGVIGLQGKPTSMSAGEFTSMQAASDFVRASLAHSSTKEQS